MIRKAEKRERKTDSCLHEEKQKEIIKGHAIVKYTLFEEKRDSEVGSISLSLDL